MIVLSLVVITFLKNSHFQQNSGASWFLKIYYKSKYCQITMSKEGIPLSAFSAPQGYYEWIVMSFGLKNAPKYSKEEWVTPSKTLITVV